MKQLIKAVKKHTRKPVFLKFDPSVPDPEGMAKTIEEAGGDGIVIMNSLGPAYPLNSKLKRSYLGSEDGFGWISGPVIKPLALAMVKRVAKSTSLPIIGVGGISSALDVIDFLMAGATAVQFLSAALIRGKSIYKRIIDDLPKKLQEIEVHNVREIIGTAKYSNNKASYEKRLPVIDKEKCTLCGLCVDVCSIYKKQRRSCGFRRVFWLWIMSKPVPCKSNRGCTTVKRFLLRCLHCGKEYDPSEVDLKSSMILIT